MSIIKDIIIFTIMKQFIIRYTTTNLCMIFFKEFGLLNITDATLFINSITVFNTYNFSATNCFKSKFVKHEKIHKLIFIIGDILVHYLPIIYYNTKLIENKEPITYYDIFRVFTWFIYYLIIFCKFKTPERFYIKCCKNRGLLQVITTPFVVKFLSNLYITTNYNTTLLYFAYLWYLRDYYEYVDYEKYLTK